MIDSGMLWGFISIIGVLAIAGIALLTWCFRGKRIDDHPICRRCEFDLTGLPKESDRCPECGSELSAARAVRIGHRRKRPLIGLAGLLLLALPSAIGAKFLYPILTDPNPDQYKPYWWLMAESRHFGQVGQSASSRELLRRLKGNLLTKDQTRASADFALDLQADFKCAWNPIWGDFVQSARSSLDDAQWDRYAQNIVGDTPRLQVRPRAARGDELPARVVYTAVRGGSLGESPALIEVRFFIDGSEIRHGARISSDSGAVTEQQPVTVNAEMLDQFESGRHTASAVVSVRAREADAPSRELRLTAPFEMLPVGTPSVALRPNAAQAPAVRNAIRIHDVQVTPQRTLLMWIDAYSPPANVAFSVVLRSPGDADVSLGSIAQAAGGGSFVRSLAAKPARLPTADHVQIILVPSIATAARTIELTEIWDGQVVYDEIPVLRPR